MSKFSAWIRVVPLAAIAQGFPLLPKVPRTGPLALKVAVTARAAVMDTLQVPLPEQAGFLIIALTAGFAAVTYWIGRRDAAAGRAPKERRPKRPPRRPRDADHTEVAPPPEPTMVDDFLPPPDSTLLDQLDDDDITTVEGPPAVPPPGPDRKPRPRTDPAAARRAPGPNRRRRRPTQRPRRPPP